MIPPISAKRAQIFFTDHKFTWSETYWAPPSGSPGAPGPTLDAVLHEATMNGGLAWQRSALLGANVEISEVRVSDDSVFRDSLVDTSFAGWAKGPAPDATKRIYNRNLCSSLLECPRAAEPEVCLRMREEATDKYRRIMFLSGIPYPFDYTGANYPFADAPLGEVVASAFRSAMQNWQGYLTSPLSIWGFVGKIHPDGFNFQIKNITRVMNTGPITVETFANHNFVAGQTVLVFRPKYQPGSINVHGYVEITSVTNTTFVFNWKGDGPVNYFQGGTAKAVALQWQKFTNIIPDVVGERKRGAVELSVRGRSRPRRNYVG